MANEMIFEIEKKKDFYHNLLVDFLAKSNDYALSEILKRSVFEIHTGYDHYTEFGRDEIGHKINIYMEKDDFLSILPTIDPLKENLRKLFNKLYRVDNEYLVVEVMPNDISFKLDTTTNQIYTNNCMPSIENSDLDRIWGNRNSLKVFISHRDKDKIIANKIQKELIGFNISSFVAHNDIEVTKEWEKEILRALQSMDILVAYITDNFFNSIWTNQEIGFALGRNIFVLPIKNGFVPHGFISAIQAMQYSDINICNQILSVLIKSETLQKNVHSAVIDNIIRLFSDSYSWARAEEIFLLLENAKYISEEQETAIVNAFYTNPQVNSSFILNGYNFRGQKKEGEFCRILNSLTQKNYSTNKSGNYTGVLLYTNGKLVDNPAMHSLDDAVPF
jgi:hypothetical protein